MNAVDRPGLQRTSEATGGLEREVRLQAIDWQVIVKRHGPIVWRTAYRLLGNHADAADCFQETFVCALQLCQRQPVRNFAALLARLATARAIDQLRHRLRQAHTRADLNDRVAVPSGNPDPSQHLQTQELAARLRWAMAQLPEQEAQAFCLRYLNGMSYRLIAKQLGIKANAAGVSLHRARAKLRELLAKSPCDKESEVQ